LASPRVILSKSYHENIPFAVELKNFDLPGASLMPIVSLRQLLDHAAEHDYGLPAFNMGQVFGPSWERASASQCP
jgi:hypothetical protein